MQDPGRNDPTRAGPARADAARAEAAGSDPARADPSRADPPRRTQFPGAPGGRPGWADTGPSQQPPIGYGGAPRFAPETEPRRPDPAADTGWLMPTPDALEQYERVQPGMADRILALSETEARYRWDAQPEASAGIGTDRVTQLAALVIIVLFFAAAVYLIGSGKQIAGCILGVVDLVALISVFATSGRLGRR